MPPPETFAAESSRARRVQLSAVLAAAVLIRALFLLTTGLARGTSFFSDDALITLRYARNLAAGHGFVFNPGEFVLGTTTPLYALLMTLPALLHLNLMAAAVCFNTLCDCLATVLFRNVIATRTASPLRRFLLTLIFAANPLIVRWSLFGMETSLLVFLAFLTTTWFWQGKPARAGVAGALIILTRPDGILFLAALTGAHALCSRSARALFKPWKFLPGFAPVVIAWLVFSQAYFHSVIPHSIVAKRIIHGFHPSSLARIFDWGRGFWMLPPLACGVLVTVRALPSRRRSLAGAPDLFDKWALTHLLWAVLLAAFFVVTRAPANIYEWYRVPLFAAFTVPAAACFLPREGSVSPATRPLPRRLLTLAFALPLAYYLASPVAGMLLRPRKNEIEITNFMNLSTGRWLRDHTPPTAKVLAGNIGYIGFFSGRRILDDVGLVSPRALPSLTESRGDPSPLLARFKPDFLALEAREVAVMKPEIERLGCRQVYEVGFAGVSAQSPYRVYRCSWN